MAKIFSIDAMISVDGKNYKGVLDFYDSKCILHSNTRIITDFSYELGKAEFMSGVTKVSFLDLYTKEKRYIQIQTPGSSSPMFIVDDDKVDEALNILRNSARPGKIAEAVFQLEDKEQAISDYNDTVVAPFLNNPYRILGVASNASNAEANDALEKLKRLDRLKVINSYQTDYKLAGFPSVQRNLAGCQHALASIKDIIHKWFWFDSAEACQKWQFESYRSQITIGSVSAFSYDLFLAKYLYALVFDNKFGKRNNLQEIFAAYQFIVGEQHIEIIRAKFNKSECVKIDDATILDSFSKHIFDPIDRLLEDTDIESMLNYFRAIRMDRYPALKSYKRNLAGKIAQRVIAQEKIIWGQIEKYIGIGTLDENAANQVWESAQNYDALVQPVLENVLNALTMEPLRSDMVKTSYKKVMEKVMILLLEGGKKTEAARYGRYLYKYADTELKLKIIAACGIESIPEALTDLPELTKTLSEKTKIEMVDESDFEDITICDSDNDLPRVDFCGLSFNHDNIGIRFWISNRTSSVLKFWLMDIEVNEQYIGSTKIICEVGTNIYDYYTYELKLPDDIRYFSVNSISFFVEIDKPGNETIQDTGIVKVKCNTITEKLSASYKENV